MAAAAGISAGLAAAAAFYDDFIAFTFSIVHENKLAKTQKTVSLIVSPMTISDVGMKLRRNQLFGK